VLSLEPMTVLGPARYSTGMTGYFWAQLKCNAVLSACLSGLVLLIAVGMRLLGEQPTLVATTVASGLALPFLLFFWLVRRMCYVVQRPALAVSASAGYFVLVAAALFALRTKGWLDAPVAFLLMGVASVFSAIYPLKELGLLSVGDVETIPLRKVVAENWNYGRWLMGSALLYPLSNQIQTYLSAGMIGLAAAGILRAIQIPSLIMTQIVTAIGLLVLPSMSYEFGMGRGDNLRKKAVLSSVGLTGLGAAYTLVLWLFAKPLEHILFRGKFAEHAHLIPVFGLVPVFTGLLLGFSMALRASQKPQFDLLANSVAAPIGVTTAIIFIKMWGIGGAALSVVVSSAASAGVLLFCFMRFTKTGQRNDLLASQT
jgi:O-antigen/teichoic acid export membrane protein